MPARGCNRSVALAVALALPLLLAACGGGDDDAERGSRTVEVADIVVHGDGRILLAGTATRGEWDSEDDDFCDGDGPATRDLAVVELTASGDVKGTHTLSEDELGGCAVEVRGTKFERDGLLIEATVRESPGLIPGDGGPETREREYATQFDPLDGAFDETEPGRASDYPRIRLPGGGVVGIAEDPMHEQQTPEGLYVSPPSLMRWRPEGEGVVWSYRISAIPLDADFEEFGFGGSRGWGLWRDRGGAFYGFAHFTLLSSGDTEVVLFRHRSKGPPDTSFGDGGRVLVRAAWFHGTKRAIRLSNGDFVVAGAAGKAEPGRIVLRRLSSEGEPRPGFDLAAAAAVACRPEVAIAARAGGGLFAACSGDGGSVVVHALGSDGRLDTSFGRGGKAVIRRI